MSERDGAKKESFIFNNVTASCRQCDWRATGPITIDKISAVLDQGSLIEKCRDHHIDTQEEIGGPSDHNVFDLKHHDRKPGFAVVGSRVVGGALEPKIRE